MQTLAVNTGASAPFFVPAGSVVDVPRPGRLIEVYRGRWLKSPFKATAQTKLRVVTTKPITVSIEGVDPPAPPVPVYVAPAPVVLEVIVEAITPDIPAPVFIERPVLRKRMHPQWRLARTS